MGSARIGIQIGASTPPAELGGIAAEAEQLGYREIWLAEDYFALGGFTSSALALAATKRIPVGCGVVAAVARHPAVSAMEIATLASGFGGRFMAGLGHGSPGWIRQMGLAPSSPMTALREATSLIRSLLDGGNVTDQGDYFRAERIQLDHPPSRRIPIYFGVHGPASLRLSGELADGTLLGWFSSPGYVSWARQRIDEGRAVTGRTDQHELVVLCVLAMSDEDPGATTRDLAGWAGPILKSMANSPQLDATITGIEPGLLLGDEHTGEQLDERLGMFAAVGSAESCMRTVDRIVAAGADRVVLVPSPGGRVSTAVMVEQMRSAAALVEASAPS